jgi:hypothetical protein
MSTPTALGSQNRTREKVIATPSQTPVSASSRTTTKPADTLFFWLDWSIKVLAVAAAVVFGIWAPLSYQATNNASASGDAAQSSILSAAQAAMSQASSAALTANSQASRVLSAQNWAAVEQSIALDAMNSRIGAIGQLWLYEFCLVYTV